MSTSYLNLSGEAPIRRWTRIPSNDVWRAALPLLVFAIPATLVANYTLNHFYVTGGYFLDSGWYSFLATHATSWPIENPAAIGGNYFIYHFSPSFYWQSALYHVFFGWTPSAVFYSLLHGALFGCIGLSVYRFIGGSRWLLFGILAAILSVLAAFNGVALASIGFPHPEIGIPAMLLLALASYYRQEPVRFVIILALGLSLREDAGLHYFGLFFLLFLWSCLPDRMGGGGKPQAAYFWMGLACLAYAGLAIFVQRVFFFRPGWDLLSHIYLGSPPFAHVTWDFVKQRLWAHSFVLYVYAPLGLTIGLFLLRRDTLILVGFLSTVPWLVLSFFAPLFQASALTSYYGFPVLVGILWPAVTYRIREQHPSYLIDLFLVTAVSTLLFVTGAKWNIDNEPWKNFGFKWIGKIDINQSAVEAVLRNQPPSGGLVIDDAVASLVPGLATKENWRFQLAWTEDEIRRMETFVFQPGSGAWQTVKWDAIVRQASFSRACRLGRSNFFIATRTAQSFPSCQPITLAR